jgi:hypothetical protein
MICAQAFGADCTYAVYSKLRARLSLKVAEKLVFIAQNSKNRSQVDDEELLLRVLTEVDEQS